MNTQYIYNTQRGTYEYMAPEVLTNKKYNNKIDIWSLGCIIYELCTLKKCFEDDGIFATLNKIINEKHGKINTHYYNEEIQNLIDKLLIKDYKERYDIDKVYDLVFKLNKQFFLDDISINILKKQNIYLKFFDEKTFLQYEINNKIYNKIYKGDYINVLFVLSDTGHRINIQATSDMMFHELAFKLFIRTGIKPEENPPFIFCSQPIRFDSCKTLAELNIRDGSRIEFITGKIIG